MRFYHTCTRDCRKLKITGQLLETHQNPLIQEDLGDVTWSVSGPSTEEYTVVPFMMGVGVRGLMGAVEMEGARQ